jgi:hypothetical protein
MKLQKTATAEYRMKKRNATSSNTYEEIPDYRIPYI